VFFGGENPFSLEGNFARSFDIAVMGINHIPVFHGVKFDQTGLLSTLPSVVNILLGYLAGRMIDSEEVKMKAVRKLLIYGVSGIAVSLLWNLVFPVNKPLWTSSFVLLTCGFASLFMGLLIWIIDIKGLTSWTKPFKVFGINPLFLYFLSEVIAITLGLQIVRTAAGSTTTPGSWLFESLFLPVAGPYNGSLLYAIVFAMVCWFAGWILYTKKIIIKL
jgi:predicted acyltransferase